MKLNVDLNCPRGSVFSDVADNVELHTGDGSSSFNPEGEAYMNLQEGAHVRFRVGSRFISFALDNAVARMRNGRLSIMAERVRRCEAKPSSRRRKS
jgi:hypothetical protein